MRRGTSRHSKLLMLACELDIDTYAAVGLACCMWDWVGETMPQGNIGSAPDRIIAQVVGWRGEPSKLVDAMVKIKLLDRHPEHRLVVHDWSEHSEDGVHVYLARRRLLFADGKAPRTRTLPSIERTEADKFYAAVVPQSKCGKNVVEPQSDHSAKVDVSERSEAERSGPVRCEPSPLTPQGDGGAAPAPKAEKTPPKLIPDFSPQFLAFWNAYPTVRRQDKQKCWKRWQADFLDREKQAGLVMENLRRWKRCDQWTKDGGQYVCSPYRWLLNRMYAEEPPTGPTKETHE